MGGSITLQSRPGEGTTVTVKLPFKIGKQDDLKPAAQVKGNISFKGLRALIVEDNELNMEICLLYAGKQRYGGDPRCRRTFRLLELF